MKKCLLFLICICVAASASGCWSKEEPKNLAIINSIIYDKLDDGQYRIIAEIMNPAGAGGTKESSASSKSPNITAISSGDNVRVALAHISESIENKIFGGHNKVRFFTESFAHDDMAATMDYLLRDHLTDETPLMVVLRADDPTQIYSAKLGLSDTVGNYLMDLSEYQAKNISQSVFITTLDFIKDFYNDGKEPVTGVIEIIEHHEKPSKNTEADTGDEQTNRLRYEGLAAFRDNQLIGYMDGIETRAYNFITNNHKLSYFTVSIDDSQTVLEVDKSKAGVKATMDGDAFSFDLHIKARIRLIAEGGTIDVSLEDPLHEIEDAFNKKLMNEISAAVEKAQHEFKSDIFGFGNTVHAEYPEKWREIKDDWNDYFTEAAVKVTVESVIYRTGEIKEPFKAEDES